MAMLYVMHLQKLFFICAGMSEEGDEEAEEELGPNLGVSCAEVELISLSNENSHLLCD